MKPFLLLAGLFLTASAIAQKHSISINYKPSLTYFGKQQQSFNHYYFASRNGDRTFNNAVNVLYNLTLTTRLSITAGLEYAQQGQNVNFNADSALPSGKRAVYKIELNYLRIPVTVNYCFFKRANAEFDIFTGISLGKALKRKDNYNDIILEDILLPPAEKRYKSNDWAIPLGINYKKKLSSKVFANMGAEYLFGLTNSYSKNPASKFGVLSAFKHSKQSRLALNIGIGLNLTK